MRSLFLIYESKQQKAAEAVMRAGEISKQASLASKSAADQTAKLAHMRYNLTKSLQTRIQAAKKDDAGITSNTNEKNEIEDKKKEEEEKQKQDGASSTNTEIDVGNNNIDLRTRVEALLLDLSSSSSNAVAGSATSLSLVRRVTAESLAAHLSGRATTRILDDQWMELGEKIPQKALGYVQKTITQALSHSLTTELSQVITSELTTAMSDMVSGLLSDSLASTIPGKTFFYKKKLIFLIPKKNSYNTKQLITLNFFFLLHLFFCNVYIY